MEDEFQDELDNYEDEEQENVKQSNVIIKTLLIVSISVLVILLGVLLVKKTFGDHAVKEFKTEGKSLYEGLLTKDSN